MTPDDLAGLHARAMRHAGAWSSDAFSETLAQACTVIVTDPPSSLPKYPGGGPEGRGQRPLLGFALGRVVADEAELLTLAVDPSMQRRGIGSALLSAFEDRVCTLGARQAFLEVAEDNTAAIGLYRSQGWSEAGHRAAYYPRAGRKSANALILRKSLGGA